MIQSVKDRFLTHKYVSVSVFVQEETDQGEEENQIHYLGQHGRAGESGAQTQIQ